MANRLLSIIQWMRPFVEPVKPVPLIYRALLCYGSTRLRRRGYFLFVGLGVLAWMNPGYGTWWFYFLVPVVLDFASAKTIEFLYPLHYEAVRSILIDKALRECEISSGEKHFTFIECQGTIEHFWLNDQKDFHPTMTLSMLAPKQNVVVLSKQRGWIFPLAGYGVPFYYSTGTGETHDVYYRSVTTISVEGNVLKLKTVDGQTITYSDKSEVAKEAVAYLREQVRSSSVHR